MDADCDDGVGCTDDTCNAGICSNVANNASCPDNGLFCDGAELCDPVDDCQSSGDPCAANETCNEITDTCDAPICLDKGASCTDDLECCSLKCRGRSGRKTCK